MRKVRVPSDTFHNPTRIRAGACLGSDSHIGSAAGLHVEHLHQSGHYIKPGNLLIVVLGRM